MITTASNSKVWISITNAPTAAAWRFAGLSKQPAGKVWRSPNGKLFLQGDDGRWYRLGSK